MVEQLTGLEIARLFHGPDAKISEEQYSVCSLIAKRCENYTVAALANKGIQDAKELLHKALYRDAELRKAWLGKIVAILPENLDANIRSGLATTIVNALFR